MHERRSPQVAPPADAPLETRHETPADTPVDTPVDAPVDAPVDTPTDTPTPAPRATGPETAELAALGSARRVAPAPQVPRMVADTGSQRPVSRWEAPDNRHVSMALDLCLRVGELLLSSGAGAADVSATMQAIARHAGLRGASVDITFTSLSMSFQADPETPPVGHARQVSQREIDYEDLTRVDHLVRDLLADRIELKEARKRLARITSSPHLRPRWLVTLGWGVMCAGVGLQLGGNATVIAIAFVAAVVIDRLKVMMTARSLPSFYQQVAGGAVATVIAAGASATPLDFDTSLVITANIIMLLSGIGFLGALQDALSGFYVTAGARLTEAVLSTSGIIAGVSGGISLARTFGVRVGAVDPGSFSLSALPLITLGGAIAAAGFAFASYAPKRSLAPIGVIAGVAIAISQSVGLGFGRAWAVAFAALFVGLVSFSASTRLKIPALVVVVSAVVPLLPGLSIYRGLSLMAEGTTSQGLLSMITAISVAIALSSGVILGEYVAQPVRRNARRLEHRLAGPRLVGPVRIPSTSRRPERGVRRPFSDRR